MKYNPNFNLFTKKIERIHKSFRLFNEKSKTLSSMRRKPSTSRNKKQIPILSIPLKNEEENNLSTLFLTSRCNNPFSLKKYKILKNIFHNTMFKNKSKNNNNISHKKISKSLFNKPAIFSSQIDDIIKESKKSEKRKKINILDFGNQLKLYDENEKKTKEKAIIEKRSKELDEIYYDYDKRNQNHIINSFSGNRADLLKNKVCFVKGIVDYLYPKLILKKMKLLNEMNEKKYQQNRENINIIKGKYYLIKNRNPELNEAISKYIYEIGLGIIRPSDDLIKIKKTFINRCQVSKLTCNYDYI